MTERTSTLIRLEKSLLEKLKEIAEEEKRSLNKQIEFILEEYVQSKASK